MSAFTDPAIEVSPQDTHERLARGEAVLIDVRESYEWEAGHIGGARHIELERLASQAESIDRETPVIFQCRIGIRSAMATQAFRAAGYDAWSMAGGIKRWADEGLPLEPEDGTIANH